MKAISFVIFEIQEKSPSTRELCSSRRKSKRGDLKTAPFLRFLTLARPAFRQAQAVLAKMLKSLSPHKERKRRRDSAPLWPAGHLPTRWGDWLSLRAARFPQGWRSSEAGEATDLPPCGGDGRPSTKAQEAGGGAKECGRVDECHRQVRVVPSAAKPLSCDSNT